MFRRSANLSWHFVSKANIPIHERVTCRFYHVVCPMRNVTLATKFVINNRVRSSIIGTHSVRHWSFSSLFESETKLPEDLLQRIPDPPAVPDKVPVFVDKIIEYHANGEPTFSSVGLGGYWPPGLIQYSMEWLHITANLPWWQTIMLCTLIVRIIIFPVIIRTQRNSWKLQNISPTLRKLQNESKEAKLSGNALEAALKAQEAFMLINKSDIKYSHIFMGPLIQGPILVSFFMALRGMANHPVESMKEGGIWWFTNLTLSDPYYLLPLITATTLFITLEVGSDMGKLHTSALMKYTLRCIPIAVFFFIMDASTAVLLYWSSTNFISLLQVAVLKLPAVRTYFNLPSVQKQQQLALANKGFINEFKNSWENMKIGRKIQQMEYASARQFQTAGRSSAPKTYKFNPAKIQTADTVKKND